MTMNDASPPTDDERRRAACHAMSAAPGLIRYAARYTRSLHDAEDAYQRAMEIALTRAPTVEPKRFMAWLRTVLRNEALAVSSARRREGPGLGADVADAHGAAVEDGVAGGRPGRVARALPVDPGRPRRPDATRSAPA